LATLAQTMRSTNGSPHEDEERRLELPGELAP
jgi:hypothetical protein